MSEDEFVIVKLPKEDYQLLKDMIKERSAYNYLTAKLKSWWVWGVVGGLVTVLTFWDSIKPIFVKV